MIRALSSAAQKYTFLLRELIARDFKVKYKRSALGMLWSLLYPVMMMAVMALVFQNVFRFTTAGVSYLSYLMTGLTLFNYFSEASNLAMSSVVANSALIRKVYMPKYIFPLLVVQWAYGVKRLSSNPSAVVKVQLPPSEGSIRKRPLSVLIQRTPEESCSMPWTT